MAKQKRLNKGQKRRIQQNREKRLAQAFDVPSDQLGASETGIIVSRYGQHADLLTADNEIIRCHIRRTVDSLVTGDKVDLVGSQTTTSGLVRVLKRLENTYDKSIVLTVLRPVDAM